MLNAAQGKHLAVQHHEIVAQMHKYVLIAVELSVQGRQKRLLTQSEAILHALKHSAALLRRVQELGISDTQNRGTRFSKRERRLKSGQSGPLVGEPQHRDWGSLIERFSC